MDLLQSASKPTDVIDEYALRDFVCLEGVSIGVFTDPKGVVWFVMYGGNLPAPIKLGMDQKNAHSVGATLLRAGGQAMLREAQIERQER